MHIYVYELRQERHAPLTAELAGVGLDPVLVEAGFFAGDLGSLTRKGGDTRPILIAVSPVMPAPPSELIRRIRSRGVQNPVIVLRDTRNAREAAEVLDAGADDVVVAPLKGVELISRVHSILRRAHGFASESVTVGEITAYFDGRDPEVSGERLKLSRREHAIFQHLILNSNRVISKGAIYDAVYGMSTDQPFDKVIDVYICKLRKKIGDAAASGQQYIETVYGRGYKFGLDAGPAAVSA
ncbi:response regulator transcription factor [Frigidibacter sp. MR17.14]|uniref:response regulator transcription factor n=1 Tax=Frigidibacter sp. MR17.14 TaxID=3126509 RepID=UPI003012EF95